MSDNALTRNFKSPWLLTLIILIVVGSLGALWFLHTFEKKEYTITTGGSPETRRNPLLAAQEYLQQTGYQSKSVKGIDLLFELPPVSDAIFIRHLPVGLSDSVIADLISWVEQGGHLLLLPHRNGMKSTHPGRTTIFERLGVDYAEQEESDCGCPDEDGEDDETVQPLSQETAEDTTKQQKDAPDKPEPDTEPESPSGPRHWLITANLDGQEIQLETFGSRLLVDTGSSAVFQLDGSYATNYEEEKDKGRSDHNRLIERDGAWLLQYRLGAGRVTVLTEMHLFTNYRIADYDHAYFLSWLTRDDSTIWLLYSTNVEPFLKIVWEKTPLFWITLAILIVLIIWRLQMQSGARLRPALDERHNIMQHIEATAQYNWRISGLAAMVKKNRKSLWNMLIGRKMGLQANRQKIDIDISRLTQKSDMTRQQLYVAFQKAIETEQDLIEATHFMQYLHAQLSGGDKKEK